MTHDSGRNVKNIPVGADISTESRVQKAEFRESGHLAVGKNLRSAIRNILRRGRLSDLALPSR